MSWAPRAAASSTARAARARLASSAPNSGASWQQATSTPAASHLRVIPDARGTDRREYRSNRTASPEDSPHMLITSPVHDPAPLRGAMTGAVVAPGEPGWDEARRAWNLAVDQRPALIAVPESIADVQAAVNFAREREIAVAVQGTGHQASAIASLEGALLIRTHKLRGVKIDAAARRARVKAGDLWQDVTGPASALGLAPLAGSSPDVGVVGYTLGGGISWLGRRYGLASNSVTAIAVVLPDGRLVRADHEHHTELFWALRGGGGAVGVVVGLEMRLYEVTDLVAGALFFPFERTAEVG